MLLSIIMPIACSDAQLSSVVTRLIWENQVFFKNNPCELVLVDSKPNSRGLGELERLIETSKDYGVSINYFDTTTVGVGLKFSEGLATAKGEYIFFMVDELISTYDFLTDAYVVAQDRGVCSVPYMESRDVEAGTFPLSYPKYASVAPVSFPFMRKDLFVEILKGMPSHWFGTLHWSLLCAKLGVNVIFSSRHLYYCPLVKVDAVRPSIYHNIGLDVRMRDEKKFRETWDVDECISAHNSMVNTLKSVLNNTVDDIHVVIGSKDGLFLVKETMRVPLKLGYLKINSEDEIDLASKRLIDKWRNALEVDTKVKRLFLSKDASRRYANEKITIGKLLGLFRKKKEKKKYL